MLIELDLLEIKKPLCLEAALLNKETENFKSYYLYQKSLVIVGIILLTTPKWLLEKRLSSLSRNPTGVTYKLTVVIMSQPQRGFL